MVKAKVIKDFRDKKTRVIHVAGTEYEGTAARIKELQKLEYLEADASSEDEKGEGKESGKKDGE